MGVMFILLTKAKNKDIDFAAQEIAGDAYQRPLERVLEGVSRHRSLATRQMGGDASLEAEFARVEGQLATAIDSLRAVDRELGGL